LKPHPCKSPSQKRFALDHTVVSVFFPNDGLCGSNSRRPDGAVTSDLPIQELSRENYATEGRVVADDLRIRTIAPPMTIANQSAKYHGSIHGGNESCPLATNTNEAAPAIAPRTRASVIVATISLPLAANATCGWRIVVFLGVTHVTWRRLSI
jgi:hypothetical protein